MDFITTLFPFIAWLNVMAGMHELTRNTFASLNISLAVLFSLLAVLSHM